MKGIRWRKRRRRKKSGGRAGVEKGEGSLWMPRETRVAYTS